MTCLAVFAPLLLPPPPCLATVQPIRFQLCFVLNCVFLAYLKCKNKSGTKCLLFVSRVTAKRDERGYCSDVDNIDTNVNIDITDTNVGIDVRMDANM